MSEEEKTEPKELETWHGTQSQYDAISSPDADTLYVVVG